MTSGDPAPSFDDQFPELAAIGYRVAYRLLGDRTDAEDVAQEALTRAYVRWGRVQGYAEPWVARVSANLALDRLRTGRRRSSVAVPAVPTSGSSTTDRMELARLLAALPRRQREVLVLRYLADRTEADTARVLGTSIGTVKQHAHRGLASLRIAWSDMDLDPTLDPGAL